MRGSLCGLRAGWLAFAALVALAPQARAIDGASPSVAARQLATVTILHLNDVYEISPVEGGKFGGLARVATVIERLRTERAPLLTTLGGDYLSPSALGTARIDGERMPFG